MRAVLVPELIVADRVRSLDFYRGLLGFKILYARRNERFAYLDRNGAEPMLVQLFGRSVNFEVHVDDVEILHKAIRNTGIALFLPLEEKWCGWETHERGVWQFAVQNPGGDLIRLSQAMGTRSVT